MTMNSVASRDAAQGSSKHDKKKGVPASIGLPEKKHTVITGNRLYIFITCVMFR